MRILILYSVTTSFMDTYGMCQSSDRQKQYEKILHNMRVLIGMVHLTKSQSGVFAINLLSLCLQVENNSCLWLSVPRCGFSTIQYFSLVQSWQTPVTGLKAGMPLSRIFQVTFGLLPASTSFQKWADRVVVFSGFLVFILFFCNAFS